MKKLFIHLTIMSLSLASQLSYSHIRSYSIPKPYDILQMRQQLVCNRRCWDFDATLFCSTHVKGFQVCDAGLCDEWRRTANVLQTWQNTQDGLAALRGHEPTDQIGSLAELFNVQGDSRAYAHFIPCGKMNLQAALCGAHYHLNPNWFFGLYLPIYHMNLHVKKWQPQEQNTGLYEESLFRSIFPCNMLGCCAHKIDRWGIGDMAALCWWHGCFFQARPLLRYVQVAARGGLILPTARKANLALLYAPSFGYNGGAGVLAGVDLELSLGNYVHAGLDVEIGYLFGVKHIEAISVDSAQTDLLFLTKQCTFRDPGLNQQFTLYGGLHNCTRQYEFTIGYQYRKQNDDTIYPVSNLYDSVIASDAQTAQEWTIHTLTLNGLYRWRSATFGVGYQYSFNGKRSIGTDGITLSAGFMY